jgi:Uncharacterized protein conserved in bacteria
MAAVGPGSTFQMGFTTFTRAANVTMTYVPYTGSAPAATAVLGQHVTSAFAGYAVVRRNKADKLRALAVATMKRIEPLPECRPSTNPGSRTWKSTIGSASLRR